MYVTMIQLPLLSKLHQVKGTKVSSPLGVLTLATYLKHKIENLSCRIVDFNVSMDFSCDFEETKPGVFRLTNEGLKKAELLCLSEQDSQGIVGINCHYNNLHIAVQLSEHFKRQNKDIKVLIGGTHAAFVAKEVMETYDTIDAVCLGEGENAFLSYVQWHLGEACEDDLVGLLYRNNQGENVDLGKAKLIDLQEMGVPDYSLIDLSKYQNEERNIWIETGRGCPYSCSFCATAPHWGRKTRYFTLDRTCDEISLLYKGGFRSFSFTHDNFTTDKRFTKDLCQRIIDLGLSIQWDCYTRTDTLDLALLPLMAKSGCSELFIGFDAGNGKAASYFNKHKSKDDELALVREAAKNGIIVRGSFICGYPGETDEDLYDTMVYATKLKLNGVGNVQFSFFRAYPGTALEKILSGNNPDKFKRMYPYFETKNKYNNAKQTILKQERDRFVLQYLLEFYPLTTNLIIENSDRQAFLEFLRELLSKCEAYEIDKGIPYECHMLIATHIDEFLSKARRTQNDYRFALEAGIALSLYSFKGYEEIYSFKNQVVEIQDGKCTLMLPENFTSLVSDYVHYDIPDLDSKSLVEYFIENDGEDILIDRKKGGCSHESTT